MTIFLYSCAPGFPQRNTLRDIKGTDISNVPSQFSELALAPYIGKQVAGYQPLLRLSRPGQPHNGLTNLVMHPSCRLASLQQWSMWGGDVITEEPTGRAAYNLDQSPWPTLSNLPSFYSSWEPQPHIRATTHPTATKGRHFTNVVAGPRLDHQCQPIRIRLLSEKDSSSSANPYPALSFAAEGIEQHDCTRS